MRREHVLERNTPPGAYSANGQNARIPSPVSHVGTNPDISMHVSGTSIQVTDAMRHSRQVNRTYLESRVSYGD
jgi:hypothetical protein